MFRYVVYGQTQDDRQIELSRFRSRRNAFIYADFLFQVCIKRYQKVEVFDTKKERFIWERKR